ncbi:MAG: CPBP family intramembrane glutamic endopeptidase [Salinispira sp.]
MWLCLIFFLIFDYFLAFLTSFFSLLPVFLPGNIIKILLLIFFMRRYGLTAGLGGNFQPISMSIALVILFLLNMASTVLFNSEAGLYLPQDQFTILLLMMIMISAVSEELFYRAWLLEVFDTVGRNRATLLAGLIFSAGHIYQGLPGVLFSLCASFVLAALYYRSGGVKAGIIVHIMYNLIIFSVNQYV